MTKQRLVGLLRVLRFRIRSAAKRAARAAGNSLIAPLYILGYLLGRVFHIADLARAAIVEGFLRGSRIE